VPVGGMGNVARRWRSRAQTWSGVADAGRSSPPRPLGKTSHG
jgi:hypothetical protein